MRENTLKQTKHHIQVIRLISCSCMILPGYAYGKTPSQEDLRSLASQFVQKIKPKLNAQEHGYTEETESLNNQLSQIPDGQTLLFRPRIGNILYDLDIMATKQPNGIFISFYDIISVFDFAINYNIGDTKADGWFLREDWKFSINLEAETVTSKNREFKISKDNLYIEGEELYIHQSTLEQWFDMEYKLDTAQQYINVYSQYPLPKVAQHYRREREDQKARTSKTARLPRKNTAYDNFDLNLADITLRSSYRKRTPSLPQPNRNSATVAVEGEALKHSAYAFANIDNQLGLNTVVARLKKENEDPTLLGPLKARSYTLGDSDTARVPLTGNTGQEFGFNISNNPLTSTDFETTEIKGDGRPGWDVELYRNGGLVSTTTIDDSGRYRFRDIQLFGGENTFELFFYGPQGEIRTDIVDVPVSSALLSTQNNTYEFSGSISNERTYQKRDNDDPDTGTPHLAGKYNFFLGDALSYVGFRSRQVNGNHKNFLGAGTTKIIGGAIIDANLAIDDEGESAGELTARKKIQDWNLALSGGAQSDAYAANDTENPQVFSSSITANKSYKPWIGTRGSITGQASYIETASGTTAEQERLTISNAFGRLNLSNSLTHDKRSGQEDRLQDTLSARYSYGKLFMRGSVEYDIKPKAEVDRYSSQFSYRATDKITSDLRLEHDPGQDFSEARVNVNYTHKNARISPFLEVDSNDEIFAGLNVNTTIVHDDALNKPLFTSDRLIGRGLVSAFVFHDKDGDMIFNGDDEPLPDVIVESINVRKKATTNDTGYSLIKGLPDNTATDIEVNEESLPDPYMIKARAGHSIFPRGGEIVNMEFPIHIAGEIDGIVTVQKANRTTVPARLVRVKLIPTDGNKNKSHTVRTAGDGFYVFSQVPPGKYLLTAHYDDLETIKAGQPTPQPVTIGYDGTTIYGQNIILSESLPPTPFKADTDNVSNSYVLNLGNNGKSKLSGLLNRMINKTSQSPILKRLKRIDDQLYTTPSGTLEESFETCQRLILDDMPCTLEQAMLSQ